jgi:hypothetical protein
VVARVLVGEERTGAALVRLAAQRGEDEERELAGEACRADQAGPGPTRAPPGGDQGERDHEERGPRGGRERGRAASGFGELRGGLGQALVVPPDPPDEAAVADLDLFREVEGLVLELAARCELAADRLGAGVVVDVLGALAARGRERLHAAVRVGLPGARGNGALRLKRPRGGRRGRRRRSGRARR